MSKNIRLFILGGPGVGKTHLGRSLQERYSISHTDLDTLYWAPSEHTATVRRSPESRDAMLGEIVAGSEWVIEGAYCAPWTQPILEQADYIMMLRTSRAIQSLRLARRNMHRLVSHTTTVTRAAQLMVFASRYDEQLTNYVKTQMEPYREKVIRGDADELAAVVDGHLHMGHEPDMSGAMVPVSALAYSLPRGSSLVPQPVD